MLLSSLYFTKVEAETHISNLPKVTFQEMAKLEFIPRRSSSKAFTLMPLLLILNNELHLSKIIFFHDLAVMLSYRFPL